MAINWNTGRTKPKGPPWKEKFIVLENATDEPSEVRLRWTDDPLKSPNLDLWRGGGEHWDLAPGEKARLTSKDKPVTAAKVCIRFQGKMTQRSNVPGPPKTRGEFDRYRTADFGPQQVVCGAEYDEPEMTEWVYTCKF